MHSSKCFHLRQRGDPKSKPGKASDYIEHFPEFAKPHPGLLVVLACRVSGRVQNHKGNLDDSEAFLRQQASQHGATVLAVFRRTESGSEPEDWAGPAEYALEAGACLLAESTDRIIRPKDFHTKNNPGAQPTIEDFERLRRITKGVQWLTVWHPDTPWKEVRGLQTKRGQTAKGQKGGRPRAPEQPDPLPAIPEVELRKWLDAISNVWPTPPD